MTMGCGVGGGGCGTGGRCGEDGGGERDVAGGVGVGRGGFGSKIRRVEGGMVVDVRSYGVVEEKVEREVDVVRMGEVLVVLVGSVNGERAAGEGCVGGCVGGVVEAVGGVVGVAVGMRDEGDESGRDIYGYAWKTPRPLSVAG